MKKYLLILLVIIGFRAISQDYYMDVVNNQTITACKGNLYPTWLCNSVGGYAGYCNNENYSVTFYSGSPTVPMKISFLSLGLAGFPTNSCFFTEAGYDFLTIIDGPAAGSPTLATLSGAIANPFSYTSTGPYLTIKFKSDNVVNDWGWFAIIGCQPQGCGGNLPASDVCGSAVALCDLNGYCGSTNGWYTPDNATLGVNLGGPFCGASGSIENNAWIKFIPNSASASININVANCSSPTQGLQAGLYSTPNCSSFTQLTCQSQSAYAPLMTLSYNSFVPGNTYYLMIDGFAGNACDYTVNASGGVAVSTVNVSSPTICNGQSTNLTAAAAGTSPSYLWNTGATSAGITVSPNVTTPYTATITSGFCTEVITKTITVNPIPTANAGTAPGSITCNNPTQTLSGSGGGSYSWSGTGIVSGGNTANPVVNGSGPFSLVVTSSGCTSTNVAQVTVPVNTTPPVASIDPPSVLNCTNTAQNLIANPTSGVSYNWTGPSGFTSSSGSPNITLGGTYNLTVTSTVNGCTGTTNVSVSQNTTAPVATINAPSVLNCTNTSQSLTGNPSSGVTYSWSGPSGFSSTSQTPNITLGGTYNLTVTSTSNACKGTTNVSVTQNTTAPAASINAPSVLNCTNTAQNLIGNPSSGATYTWSGPSGFTSNSQNPSVSLPGAYSMTVTSTANGCTNTANATVNQNTTAPTASIDPPTVLNCTNTAQTLVGNPSSGVTYSWSGPSGFSSTSVNPNITLGGTYNLTVTSTSNACKGTANVSVTQNTTAPSASIDPPSVLNCTNTAQILTGNPSSGVTYSWSGPSGFSSSSQNPNITLGGTYNLTVTSTSNACKGTTNITVTQNTTAPAASINAPATLNCNNTSITLTGNPSSGVTYTWTGPSGFTSNSATPSATLPGTYNLTVTSTANACTNTANATVNQNTTTPVLSASSQTAISGCGSSSVVVLSGTATPAGSTYTWAASGGFVSGVNNQTVSVNGANTYTLNAGHPTTGCVSSLVYTVMASSGSPTVTPLGSTTGTVTCNTTTQSTSVTVSPSNDLTYTWSGPGIVGANNTSTVTGNQAGTYNLVVTNTLTSCQTNSFSFVITADNSPVSPNAVISNSVDCASANATITASPSPAGAFTYSWSTGATNVSSVVVSPTSNTNYVVTVTNTVNGCTGSQTVSAIANTNPPTAVSVSPNNFTLSCATPTTVLSANATGAASYTWITSGGTILSSSNQSTIAIQGGGTYSVIAIAANSCSAAAASATITPDSNAPTITLSNASPSITCNNAAPGVSVTLTSTVPVSYSWTPSTGIAGSNTTSAVSFTAPGTYTGVVTATNGCSTSTTVVVSTNTTAPSFVAGTGTAQALSCTNSVVTISPAFTPSANLTYTWSGNGISGSANNSTVAVNQAGTYTVAVTNTLTGCVSTSPLTITVTGSNVTPTANIASSSSIGISCQPNSSTVTLTASGASGLTYTWSTGENTSAITTSLAGTYTVNFTDPVSGCVGSATTTVQNNSTSPSLNSSASGNLPCGSGSATLSATSTNTSVTYLWTGSGVVSGSNTPNCEVNAAGIYTVSILDPVTGCSSTSTVGVTQTTVSAGAAASATTGPAPLNVNFSNTSSGASTYSWTFGNGNSSTQTAPAESYGTPGIYTVTLVSVNGSCAATATLLIEVLAGLGDVPEVFTPNGDTKNETFVITGLDAYPKNSLQVFNRWGNPVYTAAPYKNDWDGSPNAAGKTGSDKLPTGTYYYILDLGDEKTQPFRGFIQIQY